MISGKKIDEIKSFISHPYNWDYRNIAQHYKTSHSTARRYVRLAKAPRKRFPKVLLLDIETSPLEVYAWEIGSRVSLGHYQIKHEWFILSWAGKWLLKNGMLFGLSKSGSFYCINAKDGQTVWTDTNKIDRFGSIIDTGSCLLALSPKSQLIVFEPNDKAYKELASYKVADSQIHAHPVVAGNRIFIKDKDSVILWTIK